MLRKQLGLSTLILLFALVTSAYLPDIGPAPEGELLLVEYTPSKSKTIINTMLSDRPVAAREPMALVSTCGKDAPEPGEVFIRLVSHRVQSQSGGSESLSCEKMPISEEWIEVFNQSAESCLSRSAKKIGWSAPSAAALNAMGAYIHKGRRESKVRRGRLSLHASARALDISSFELMDSNGHQRTVDVSQASQRHSPSDNSPTLERRFLLEFRKCWTEALSLYTGCRVYKSGGFRGSVGWENVDHQNHLHLSVPYCPKNPHFLGD